jgi:L-ascorbate metabolism protein UlaG (beta-lactamase superfamily)
LRALNGEAIRMFRFNWFLVLAALALGGPRALAAEERPSHCMAIARAMPPHLGPVVIKAAFQPASEPVASEVKITYAGHSTFVIESRGGVRIATDFSGFHGASPPPRVVTMNKAHSSHFTAFPDPGIEHVLKGWNPDGGPARHRLVVDDVYIRNVTTDIRSGESGVMEADGNSIFIFEVADLCIGHLGHLHHLLDDSDYGAIGRLDIVMVPVDGGLTLSHEGMSGIVKRLYSSMVLPMHRRMTTIDQFLARVRGKFEVRYANSDSITVSLKTLPDQPTIMILDGL